MQGMVVRLRSVSSIRRTLTFSVKFEVRKPSLPLSDLFIAKFLRIAVSSDERRLKSGGGPGILTLCVTIATYLQ